MIQALAVADKQRDVMRSFSRNEHRHEHQTSTPLPLMAAVEPALLEAVSLSMPPVSSSSVLASVGFFQVINIKKRYE